MQERIQKVIAASGVASRRKAEELITQGRVTVNGQVVNTLGSKVRPTDKITVDGIQLEKQEKYYILFYKPRGVISSVSDPQGRRCVSDWFKEIPARLYPVGRLDYDTSGLILMTNDGDFSNMLMHPRYEIKKTYVAKIKGYVSREDQEQLTRGIMLEDGKTAPAKVNPISFDKVKNTTLLEITIHEGRNRQVRRMFEALGHKVDKLRRESFGSLNLKGLNAGESRHLTFHEVKQLRNMSQNKQN
ncbi:MAG: pseudouridine synthase [Bacilli bacterium]